MSIIVCRSSEFGKLSNGQVITQYTLSNEKGMSISIINYGATLTSVQVPDSNGNRHELTLGFDQLDDYISHEFYFGATIGRVANRIANAHFNYQKKDYYLSKNKNFEHHLHGGEKGLDKRVWRAHTTSQKNQTSVSFSYLSPNGDQGYPGNLDIEVTYSLTTNNELKISFQAKTDQATPVDLTNHAYWNLAGAGNGTVLNHVLQIFSDCYVVTDKDLLATGKLAEVKGTPFDFRKPHSIGERIQDIAIGGYDLCYVLPPLRNHQPQFVARINEPISGRSLEVFTTQPGLQFYTSNTLRDYLISSGLHTHRNGAFCMETQNLPGAVKYPEFPSPFLLSGNNYQHETIYR
ncbi:MAG: galactose mutarotase [Gammaproteobacteria bacterium]|nr:MAG: galactose mutarotase [Gammaproteobacteria bacterium]